MPLKRTRAAPIGEEDASNLYWVVSYADMLMVLMSFFIIFFEMDNFSEKKGTGLLQQLAINLTSEGAASASPNRLLASANVAGGGTGTSLDTTQVGNSSVDNLAQKLHALNLQFVTDVKNGTLTVDFKPSLYPAGGFEFPSHDLKEFKVFLDLLRPLINEVHLVVEGHTDDVPIAANPAPSTGNAAGRKIAAIDFHIDTNFILANLRATKAAQVAIAYGIPSERISAQSAGKSNRKTRSLTVRIVVDAKGGSP